MAGWSWLFITILVILAKSLPFVWHLRFFWALLGRNLFRWLKTPTRLTSQHLFLPSILAARVALSECDFNLHKSNATYFTDLDIARSHLSGILFSPLFFGSTALGRCNLVVGAVSCVFRKEIKPYQHYELWTKIASWDEKWIYMVTHFVPAGTFRPQNYVSTHSQSVPTSAQPYLAPREGFGSAVLASAITRMVFKRGRVTVCPTEALEVCGFLTERTRKPDSPISPKCAPSETISGPPPVETETTSYNDLLYIAVEKRRETNLPIVQLQNGWDAVHSLFQPDAYALGRHNDFI